MIYVIAWCVIGVLTSLGSTIYDKKESFITVSDVFGMFFIGLVFGPVFTLFLVVDFLVNFFKENVDLEKTIWKSKTYIQREKESQDTEEMIKTIRNSCEVESQKIFAEDNAKKG